MVGRADHHGVDILARKHLPEVDIREAVLVAVLDVDCVLGLRAMFGLDVAHGQDLGVGLDQELLGIVAEAFVAQADAADRDAFRRRLGPQYPRRQDQRNAEARDRCAGHAAQRLAPSEG